MAPKKNTKRPVKKTTIPDSQEDDALASQQLTQSTQTLAAEDQDTDMFGGPIVRHSLRNHKPTERALAMGLVLSPAKQPNVFQRSASPARPSTPPQEPRLSLDQTETPVPPKRSSVSDTIKVLLDSDHDEQMSHRAMLEAIRFSLNTAWRARSPDALRSVWLRQMLYDSAAYGATINGPTDMEPKQRWEHLPDDWNIAVSKLIGESQRLNKTTYEFSVKSSFITAWAYFIKEFIPAPMLQPSYGVSDKDWLKAETFKLTPAARILLSEHLPELKDQATYDLKYTIPDLCAKFDDLGVFEKSGYEKDIADQGTS